MNTLDRTRAVIADKVGLPASDIGEDQSLDDLKFDSLDKVDLALALEEHFGIDIPDRQVDDPNMGTARGIAAWIDARLRVDPRGKYPADKELPATSDIAKQDTHLAAAQGGRTWSPHVDYAGEPMPEGRFRGPPSDEGMPHLAGYIEQCGTPETKEEAIRERDFWIESAAQFSRNEDYYRGLVDKIGEMLGEEAYIADDGSRSQDILRNKVPELVRARLDMAQS